MKEAKSYAQMRKGVLEMCILTIISNREMYTSDILKTLKEVNLVVVEGTIYPLLSRLKNEGVLTYRWEESTAGPPRKYYNLTEKGQVMLTELEDNWNLLAQSVQKIINLKSTSHENNS